MRTAAELSMVGRMSLEFFKRFDRLENAITKAMPKWLQKVLWPVLAVIDSLLEGAYKFVFAFSNKFTRSEDQVGWKQVFNHFLWGINLPYWTVRLILQMDPITPLWVKIAVPMAIYVIYFPSTMSESFFSFRRKYFPWAAFRRGLDGAIGAYILTAAFLVVRSMQ